MNRAAVLKVALLLVVALTGCEPLPPRPVSAPAASPSPVPPIVLGAILSVVEDGGPSGTQRIEAAKLTVDLVNRRGGVRLPSGEQKTIVLSLYDDGGQPERAASAVSHLADEGAIAAIGPSNPEIASAVRAAGETAKLPLVGLHPAGEEVRPSPWAFSVSAPAEEALAATLDFFAASGVDRFGWLAPRTMEASSLRRALLRLASERRMQVAAEETYPPGAEDFARALGRIQAAGPRVILGWPRDSHEAASIAREVPKVRDLVPVFLGPNAATPATLASAGEASAVVRTVTLRLAVADDLWDHDPLTPIVRDFRREMQGRTGQLPTPEAAEARDAVELIVAALERVGTGRGQIRDAIEGTEDFAGASGPISFSPTRHDGLDRRAYIVARSEGRRWRLPP